MFVADRHRGLARALLAGAMAACLGLLAGCSSGGSAPRSLPPLSATPAAVTSTAPPTSKAAELAAVKAVVRRYYQLLNAPTTVANANALAALMTADCPCQRAAGAVRRLAQANRHYFGHARVVSLRPSIDGPNIGDVYVQYDYSTSGYAAADGRVLHEEPGRRGVKMDFRLLRARGTWLISQVVAISQGSP